MFRTRTITATIAALALAVTLSACSASTKDKDTAPAEGSFTAGAEAPTEAAKPAAPGIGTPVTSGTFEYTVLSVADAGTTIGEEPLTQTAQGTYVRVDLRVANVGKKGETFFSSFAQLVDAEGRLYEADTMASIYLKSNSLVTSINPGNALEGPLIFDVPVGTVPVSLQVTDSLFSSDGEQISLG